TRRKPEFFCVGLQCETVSHIAVRYIGNVPSGVKGMFLEDAMNHKLLLGWVAIVLGLLSAGRGYGQSTTATILGTVTDKSGAVVAGVSVTARNTQTNLARTVAANEQGEYRIEFLPVGTYDLEVSGKGFKKAVLKGIALQVSVDVRADVQMELGDINDAITVT